VEVPVEKIVYIYDKKEENSVPNIDKIRDKNEINELLLKIQQLENQEPIIKEVIIEVEKSNDKTLLLQETLNKLRKELTDKNTKITELEGTIKKLEQTNINQGAAYMKGSNLTKNI
jgi:predicted RNase H-like nuclease (RuvC/YqgF family)